MLCGHPSGQFWVDWPCHTKPHDDDHVITCYVGGEQVYLGIFWVYVVFKDPTDECQTPNSIWN